ncbi:hypothetical protein Bca52824_029976 [Brassica carinata]|uniref:Leucine-rich repeat-containing N-terminal plant-type domain-containing protein n=1 Tax=Brassica carinata TaxID=52824 RepID=A0A8X7S7F1_BRACI|nr:hypothetical protein Bca52824_029976 [Brassica carinata]
MTLLPFLFAFLTSLPLTVISQLDERSTLLNLKRLLAHPPSLPLWNATSSPCQWPEITCFAGKVTGINFTNQNFTLTGVIPSVIAKLPRLKDLKLFTNKLTGEIPVDIGFNSKLESFEVSENQLTGKLPENLCNGGRLLGVVVYSNKLTGVIPDSLGDCKTLLTVQLQNNNFSGEFPSRIWTLSHMYSLQISNNSFIGKLPERVAWNLSRIEIDNNNFSGEIPSTIGSWSSLAEFKAGNNGFSGEIPKEITSLSNLISLFLDKNSLSGELPDEIVSWKSLTTINLSKNKLSGKIPSGLGSLPHLLNLDLSENGFSGVIPPEIGNLKLTTLNLSSNRLTGEVPDQLDNLAYERSFFNNLNLCADKPVLNLPDCRKVLQRSKGLPGNIFAMVLVIAVLLLSITLLGTFFVVRDYTRKRRRRRGLETWKLTSFHRVDFVDSDIVSNLMEHNVIGSGGPIEEAFDEDIKEASNIEEMTTVFKLGLMCTNTLPGNRPTMKEILYMLRQQGHVETKKIASEAHEAPLLVSLSGRRTSKRIEDEELAGNNGFSGEIPKEITSLSNLISLFLDKNSLSGELPDEIVSWKSLTTINLSKNKLSGKIPSGLGSLPHLLNLDLSENGFSGVIPPEIGELSELEELRMSYNDKLLPARLTGKLPENLCNGGRLLGVVVYSNKLTGVIPDSLGDSGNNGFSGEIPKEITSLSNLISLFLDKNSLSGELPDEIVSWKSLTTINLSKNKLSGKIPSGLGSLPHLLNLDLSENGFSGVIPPEIGNLKLTTLNLSSNRLTGEVPDQLDNLAYERSFFNNLNLCADKPVLNLPDCRKVLQRSKGLPGNIFAMVLVIAVLLLSITLLGTFFVVRDYTRKRRRRRGLETWKLTSFHRVDFVDSDIVSNLMEHNVIGSGGPIEEAFDEDIKEASNIEEMTTVFKLGLMCTNTLPGNRPTMKEILYMLRQQGHVETKKIASEAHEAPLLVSLSGRRTSKRIEDEELGFV